MVEGCISRYSLRIVSFNHKIARIVGKARFQCFIDKFLLTLALLLLILFCILLFKREFNFQSKIYFCSLLKMFGLFNPNLPEKERG